MFRLYDRRICTHSIDPSLVDGECPGLELALVPNVVVPEAEYGASTKQKSCFKFLPWPGFEPRTLQSNGHERYRPTVSFSYCHSLTKYFANHKTKPMNIIPSCAITKPMQDVTTLCSIIIISSARA